MSLVLNIRNQFRPAPVIEAHSQRKFNKESGLVYNEKICHGTPVRADWVWKTRGSSASLAKFRSQGRGCSTLKDMAIRSACMNAVSLTADTLEGLPWPPARTLWKSILAHDLESLHAWKVFAAAYPDQQDESSLRRRQMYIAQPNMALPDYVKQITASDFQWITFLNLAHVICSRRDLVGLSKLSNIGTLTLGKGVKTPDTNGMDDNLIRTWSRAATEAGAFSMLRVLACRSQRDLTPQVLLYATQFPCLAVFLVEDCHLCRKERPFANSLGWKYKTGKELDELLVPGGCTNGEWLSTLNASFVRGGKFGTDRMTQAGFDAMVSLPVLDFSLGMVPDGTVVGQHGNKKLRCFFRDSPPNTAIDEQKIGRKRPLDEPKLRQQNTKRVLKPFKQQFFEF